MNTRRYGWYWSNTATRSPGSNATAIGVICSSPAQSPHPIDLTACSEIGASPWLPPPPFALAYRARLRRGMLPTRAKLTICRKLIDVLCAMWISQEDYAPDQIKSD